MPKALNVRPFLVLLGGALLSCAATNASAQSYNSYNSSQQAYPGINLGQATPGVNGSTTLKNNDCAPVATANGLGYLDPGLDNATTINTLMGASYMDTSGTLDSAGTTQGNAITGLDKYLAAYAPNITAIQTPDNPTFQTLISALNAGSAVQLGIVWGTEDENGNMIPYGSGGHFVSLTGINNFNYNPTTGYGYGMVSLLDPWGLNNGPLSDNADATASTVNAFLYAVPLLPNGPTVLEVIWPGVAQGYSEYGPDDTYSDNGTGTTSFGSYKYGDGYIEFADIETVVVPEPTTMSLLLLPFGAGVLRMLRKNRGA
jgi:hypothetical protein